MANAYLALDNELEIVPVINKIDLPSADAERRAAGDRGCHRHSRRWTVAGSLRKERAQRRAGAEEGRYTISPHRRATAPRRSRRLYSTRITIHISASLFMSAYFDGSVKAGDRIRMMSYRQRVCRSFRVGHDVVRSDSTSGRAYEAGDVGYLTASIKTVSDTRVGDTVTLAEGGPSQSLCPGYQARRCRWSIRGIYHRRRSALRQI